LAKSAACLALSVAFAASLTPSARAHGERDPALRSIIDTAPRVRGLEVRVAPGVAQRLEVRNTSGRTLEVLAMTGEPFLRIGPRGVEANLNSRAWYASGNATGVVRAPRSAGPPAAPRWRSVSDRPRWGWFAHELHPDTSGSVPAAVVRAGRPARLGKWRVAVKVDGEPREVTGHFEYRPVRGNLSARLTTPPQVAAGVSVAVLQGRTPGLFMTSTSRRTVVVEGVDGLAFARLGPGGAELNVAGETYRQQPDAPAGTPAGAGSGAGAARWRHVSDQASLSWIEPRAAYARDEPPAAILARPKPTVLKRWSVGVRVGGRRTNVGGQTLWVPLPASPSALPGGSRAPSGGGGGGLSPIAALAAAAAVAAALAGALLLRSRRRSDRQTRASIR